MSPPGLRICAWVALLVAAPCSSAGGAPGSAPTDRHECPVIEDCVVDYLNFPRIAPDPASPLSNEQVGTILDRMDHQKEELDSGALSGARIRTLILDGLNINQLISEMDPTRLRVQFGAPRPRDSFTETTLSITDPYVGRLSGTLFSPGVTGPHPGVLAVHGHTDTPGDLFERIGLRQLVEAGFVVLLLEQRGAGADYWEDRTTRRLIRAGHSFLGLRIYESLLGLHVLRSLPSVRPDRIGLLGHSGGSVVSNLTVWLNEGFGAYVSDHSSNYFNLVHGWLGDETSPAMHRLHLQINRLESAPTPTLRAPYDYPMGQSKSIRFFTEHLTRSASP